MKAEAEQLLQQGIAQCEQEQFAAALQSWQKALKLYQTLQDIESQGKIINNLGFAYKAMANYPEAIKAYKKSLEIGRQINNLQMQLNALAHLGNAYDNVGDYVQAIEFYQQALPLAQKLTNRPGEGTIAGGLAVGYEMLGDYQEAAKYYQLMFIVAQEYNDRPTQAAALSGLGRTYQALKNYLQAAECLEQRLAIAREIHDEVGEQAALTILGNVYHSLGNYMQAIELLQQSLVLAKTVNNPAIVAEGLNNLGNNYADLCQYEQAIESYQESLKITQEINNPTLTSQILLNLGTLYQGNLGDAQRAIDFYQQSLNIPLLNENITALQVRELLQLQAETCVRIASIHQLLAENEQAIAVYQQALEIAEEINNNGIKAEILNNIGTLYHRNLGDYQEAIKFYRQSLNISEQINNPQSKGKALGNLGSAYDALQNYTQAIDYQQQRLALAEEIQDLEGKGLALNNLGVTLLHTGNFFEAEQTLFNSIQLWEDLRSTLGSNDAAKISIFEEQARTYRLLQKALIAQGKTDTALEIAERGRTRAFVDLLTSRLNLKLADVNAKVPVTTLTIKEIKELAKAYNVTLVEYSIIYETLEVEGQPTQATETQLLIWVVQPTSKIAFHLVNLNLLQQQNTSLSDLVVQVRAALSANESPDSNSTSSLLKQLYELLIEDIVDFLPDDPARPVIFIPQGDLFLVPFNALQDKEGNYLIAKHTILIAPSIQVLNLILSRPLKKLDPTSLDSHKVLVVGNPKMPAITPKIGEPPRQLAALPASGVEASAIASLLGTAATTGEEATKVKIVSQMPSARLIHLATHGLLNDIRQMGVPGAIALAPCEKDNGFLTAGEILNLHLNAELVVLSACVTGLGKITGDGVIGLSRCLMAAGVSRVVVSLWAVDSFSTALLMIKFHEILNTMSPLQPTNVAKALNQAQKWLIQLSSNQAMQELEKLKPHIYQAFAGKPERLIQARFNSYSNEIRRADYPFVHPNYWAAFITIGL